MPARRPEVSISAGLAMAALVYSIYSRGMPPLADIRRSTPGEADQSDIDVVRRQNAWLAGGTVAGVSLIAKDPTIFIVGGAMVVALDWMHRHANSVSPFTGKIEGFLTREEQMQPTQAMDDGAYGPELVAVG